MVLLLNEAVCSTGLLNIDSQQKIPDTKAVMTGLYFVSFLVNLLHLSVFSLVTLLLFLLHL